MHIVKALLAEPKQVEPKLISLKYEGIRNHIIESVYTIICVLYIHTHTLYIVENEHMYIHVCCIPSPIPVSLCVL